MADPISALIALGSEIFSGVGSIGAGLEGALGGAGAAGALGSAITPLSELVVTAAPAAAAAGAGISPALAAALAAGGGLAGAGAAGAFGGASSTPTTTPADQTPTVDEITVTGQAPPTVAPTDALPPPIDLAAPAAVSLPSDLSTQVPDTTVAKKPNPLEQDAERYAENKVVAALLGQTHPGTGGGGQTTTLGTNSPSSTSPLINTDTPGTNTATPPLSSTNFATQSPGSLTAPVTGASVGTPFSGGGSGPGASIPGGLAINGSTAPNIFPWTIGS